MKQFGIPGERLVGLFMLAVLLLNPPLLLIFDRPSTVAGIPLLYLYLFFVWAFLIALLAVIIELAGDGETGSSGQTPIAEPLPEDAPGRVS